MDIGSDATAPGCRRLRPSGGLNPYVFMPGYPMQQFLLVRNLPRPKWHFSVSALVWHLREPEIKASGSLDVMIALIRALTTGPANLADSQQAGAAERLDMHSRYARGAPRAWPGKGGMASVMVPARLNTAECRQGPWALPFSPLCQVPHG